MSTVSTPVTSSRAEASPDRAARALAGGDTALRRRAARGVGGTGLDRHAAAGAVVVDEVRLDDGSHLIMMRDPWGLALQLCKRGTTLLGNAEHLNA